MSVEEVIIADAPISIPCDDLNIVSDVLGTFILWPKDLVFVRADDEETPVTLPIAAPSTQEVAQPQLNAMQQVILMACGPTFGTRTLPMNSAIGKSRVSCFLEKDDLMSLIAPQQHLMVAIVQIFLL